MEASYLQGEKDLPTAVEFSAAGCADGVGGSARLTSRHGSFSKIRSLASLASGPVTVMVDLQAQTT